MIIIIIVTTVAILIFESEPALNQAVSLIVLHLGGWVGGGGWRVRLASYIEPCIG